MKLHFSLLWTAQVDTCTALETDRISTKNVDREMKNTHSVLIVLQDSHFHISGHCKTSRRLVDGSIL